MEDWQRVSLLLCVFGFLKELCPSTSFITNFLVGPWKNITQEQLNRNVYPVATYSTAALLVMVFLLTDFLRYKPIILLSGFFAIASSALFLWTNSLPASQAAFFCLGSFMAAEVAYYTYIYAKVDRKHYAKVTSHTRAATLCGKLGASSTGQILIYFQWMNYKQLYYITLASQIAATFWVLLLPSVKTSLYFHRSTEIKNEENNNGENKNKENKMEENIIDDSKKRAKLSEAFDLLWRHFKNAYTNANVVKWSMWYILGFCGFLQVSGYIQIVWNSLSVDNDTIWNGACDTVFTFFGALVSLLVGYLKVNPREIVLLVAVLSICEGLSLILASWTTTLLFSYLGYVLFGVLYSFTIACVSAQIAQHLEEDSFGLVFGFNTFIAIVLQVILTSIVVRGSALDIKGQFTVYTFYFVAVGVFYFGWYLFEFLQGKQRDIKVAPAPTQ